MNRTSRIRLALVVTFFLTGQGVADAATRWESYPGLAGVGFAGLEIGDFDGDGMNEVAVTASVNSESSDGGPLLATLAAKADGTLELRSITQIPALFVGQMVPAVSQGQGSRLAVGAFDWTSGYQIYVIGGDPLGVMRSLPMQERTRVFAVADVDADGSPEIVALKYLQSGTSEGVLVILDFETGAVEWQGSDLSNGFAVAQLDSDAGLEIVQTGTPGKIIDGVTHDTEWTYPSGFGSSVVTGHFDSDPSVVGFATNDYTKIQVFRSQPYLAVSEFHPEGAQVMRTVQMTEVGPDLIAIGEGQWGEVSIYDPRNGQHLFGSPNPEHGVSSLAVGDVDQDGHAELVYGAGATSSTNALIAVDLVTQSIDYSRYDEMGPFSAVALGDLDGNGSSQVAYVTVPQRLLFEDQTTLYVVDASTGEKLRSRVNVLTTWHQWRPLVAVAQLDPDPQQEIVVAGGDSFRDQAVAVVDGLTLQDQWRVNGSNVVGGGVVQCLSMLDVNGDGVLDPVAATSWQIVVLDGRNGTVISRIVTSGNGMDCALAVFRTVNQAPRIAFASSQEVVVFDALSGVEQAHATLSNGLFIGLTQWGEGPACRLAALDDRANLSMYRCDDLSLEARRTMPQETLMIRPLDSTGSRLIAAAGKFLHAIAPDDSSYPISGPLGKQLGSSNFGIITPMRDGVHADAIVGSEYMVTRVTLNTIDAIYSGGFE